MESHRAQCIVHSTALAIVLCAISVIGHSCELRSIIWINICVIAIVIVIADVDVDAYRMIGKKEEKKKKSLLDDVWSRHIFL